MTQDISRRRLTVCLHHARRVSVRDEPSRQICTQWLGRPDAECAPDPAFALAPPHARARRKVLAVNVAAIGAPTWPVQDADGYRTYLDGLSALVVAAAAQMGLDAIEIVTTNPAVDLCAARDLAARLQGQTSLPVTLPPLRDVTDVLDAFAGAELAIVTRLHAGIMAAIAGCRVLPIAYQPKVAAVLAEQGIVQNVIVLEDIRLPDFDAAFSLHAACQHPAGVPPQTRAQALAAIRDLLQGGTAGEGHT